MGDKQSDSKHQSRRLSRRSSNPQIEEFDIDEETHTLETQLSNFQQRVEKMIEETQGNQDKQNKKLDQMLQILQSLQNQDLNRVGELALHEAKKSKGSIVGSLWAVFLKIWSLLAKITQLVLYPVEGYLKGIKYALGPLEIILKAFLLIVLVFITLTLGRYFGGRLIGLGNMLVSKIASPLLKLIHTLYGMLIPVDSCSNPQSLTCAVRSTADDVCWFMQCGIGFVQSIFNGIAQVYDTVTSLPKQLGELKSVIMNVYTILVKEFGETVQKAWEFVQNNQALISDKLKETIKQAHEFVADQAKNWASWGFSALTGRQHLLGDPDLYTGGGGGHMRMYSFFAPNGNKVQFAAPNQKYAAMMAMVMLGPRTTVSFVQNI
jgi:regulator of replication initiation timing